ncbi:MAG: ACT domain-containing protein [Planctomycetota bacterium]|nr:ACT domain-containing protein [Planctomycetota bacterium]
MRVLTENEVRELARRLAPGETFAIPPDAILTPLARDFLRERGVQLAEREPQARRGARDPDDALVEAVAAEVSRTLQGEAAPQAAASPQGAALERVGRHSGGAGGVGASQRAVVWGIGADAPGILAAVAELLGEKKINILEISQTILSGVFAMVMIVDVSQATCSFGELKNAIEAIGRERGLNLSAQRDEIFQYMHRV